MKAKKEPNASDDLTIDTTVLRSWKNRHNRKTRSEPTSPLNHIPPAALDNPEILSRIIEEDKRELQFERDNLWQTCCGCGTDQRLIKYLMQGMVTFPILFFCMYQLTQAEACDCSGSESLYWGGITGILGLYAPNIMNNNNNNKNSSNTSGRYSPKTKTRRL